MTGRNDVQSTADGSVSRLLRETIDGSESSAARLWDRYRSRMTRYAAARVHSSFSSVADAEDVILCAFANFLRRVREQAYPNLKGRDDLWRLLATITANEARKQNRDMLCAKRGGARAISSLHEANHEVQAMLQQLASPAPPPDLIASMNEQLEWLLNSLDNDLLREVAVAKMEGCTHIEIADATCLSVPTIERKVRLIREIWRELLAS